MHTVIKSEAFSQWLAELTDKHGQARIAVGDGVSEMRIDAGPGYRVYFTQHGRATVVLLCGGDKGSQKRDIERAKKLAKEWKEKLK